MRPNYEKHLKRALEDTVQWHLTPDEGTKSSEELYLIKSTVIIRIYIKMLL